MRISATVEITPQQIADQFVTSFEGGSNYWLHDARADEATKAKATEKPWYSSGAVFDGAFTLTLGYDNPEDGAELTSKIVTAVDVQKGLEVMAAKYPEHFTDLVKEEGDAITADVFVQCVLFGELVYG